MVRAALAAAMLAAACTGTAATTTSQRPVPPPPTPAAIPPTTAATTTTTTTSTTAAIAPCPDLTVTGQGAQAWNAELAAFDLPTGRRRWTVPLGELPQFFGVPFAASPEVVVVQVRDRLWALDEASCEVRWDRAAGRLLDLAAGPGGRLAVLDSLALRMLDARSGEQLWSYGYRWEAPEPPPRFDWQEDLLAMTTPDRELVMLDPGTGEERLRVPVETEATFLSVPVVDGERVVVTHDGIVEARSVADGAPVWAVDAGFHIYPGVATDGDAVFVVSSQDATVAALDAASGALRWRRTVDELLKFEAPPVIDHGEVHVLDTDRQLHHLDPADGSSIFVGDHRTDRTTWAAGSGLVLHQGGGALIAYSMLERRAWELTTGTAPPGRVSVVEIAEGYAATLTFDTSPP